MKQVRRDNHMRDCELMIHVASVITRTMTVTASRLTAYSANVPHYMSGKYQDMRMPCGGRLGWLSSRQAAASNH